MNPIIIGAGFAGLLAANTQFQRSEILEASSEDDLRKHTALLRFRSPDVGNAVGIPFKKVQVHKSIWIGGLHYQCPNICLANKYSQKVIGGIADRSIWNLDTCERWIAPENLQEQLIERCKDRIHWSTPMNGWIFPEPQSFISTMPLPIAAKLVHSRCYANTENIDFKTQSIITLKWRVKSCNVHQTIYYPNTEINLYRASIVGDILTAEYVSEGLEEAESACEQELEHSFGLSDLGEFLGLSRQKFGKISPIDELWRKNFVFNLSNIDNIYSLGRFATWRQILLDDVLKDINVIKRLIEVGNHYDAAMVNSK